MTLQLYVPSFLGSQQVPCPLACPRGQKHGVMETDTVIAMGQFPPKDSEWGSGHSCHTRRLFPNHDPRLPSLGAQDHCGGQRGPAFTSIISSPFQGEGNWAFGDKLSVMKGKGRKPFGRKNLCVHDMEFPNWECPSWVTAHSRVWEKCTSQK